MGSSHLRWVVNQRRDWSAPSSVFTPQAEPDLSRSANSRILRPFLFDDEFDEQLNDEHGFYRPISQDGFRCMSSFIPPQAPRSGLGPRQLTCPRPPEC